MRPWCHPINRIIRNRRVFCTTPENHSHLSPAAKKCIALEKNYGVTSTVKLPIVLSRGYGARVWDIEDREYLDFSSGNCVLNLGHCHPRLVTALASQAAAMCQTQQSSHSDKLGAFLNQMCTVFEFEKCLPLKSTSEACMVVMKLTRRWARKVKGISESNSVILLVGSSATGRILIATHKLKPRSSISGFQSVEFDNLDELKQAISNPKVAAVVVSPIQDEDVHVPSGGYLQKLSKLCLENNVLLIADETITGIGRIGTLLGMQHEGIKPDLAILGESLGGGFYPISAVMGRSDIVDLLRPSEATMSMNESPLAHSVAGEVLKLIVDENLSEKAETHGKRFRETLRNMGVDWKVRGLGLLNAVELPGARSKKDFAARICFEMARRGVLATHRQGNIIHLAPPLVISAWEMEQATSVIRKVIALPPFSSSLKRVPSSTT